MKPEDLEILIRANHILHHQNVVDAYGHISMRHPDKPDVFIMSGDRAPALVSKASDLIQYNVSDSSPVDPSSKKGYSERFIHSEIYKKYSHINSVIHSHSQAVLPYTMSGVPMRAAFHIAGFLGHTVPVYDIIPLYKPGEQQDLLVNSERFGSVLAGHFSSSSPEEKEEKAEHTHDHNVVLMSNHGFTTLGTSVPQAVYRAVYTHINAGIQSQALALRSSCLNGVFGKGYGTGADRGEWGFDGMRFLDTEELKEGCTKMNDASQHRPWEMWVREVEVNPLYRLEIGVKR
ncbi:uncharacterized protein PAC_06860 [Phialocephala subalpina]|uniref:Class II aldolase/adducin N-terminal domain-containing protein n=1 Tax=Phialocephala subalpina TaxID=576137 RepID=A0A1L7WW22_9HELO|nr:uncharacterized protein PAC_06860 [Phialocephala subalpina]